MSAPRLGRPSTPPDVRFWAKVQGGDFTGCWLWTACTNPAGYGEFRLGVGRRVFAHRYAYQSLIAEIPDGLVMDHLCRVRNCVNPWHLDPVTDAVNVRRGAGNASKTACVQGHPLSGSNLYPGAPGRRICWTCQRDRQRDYRRRQRAVARTAA